MARRRGSNYIDLSDITSFDRVTKRLEQSQRYYQDRGRQRMAEIKGEIQTKFLNPMLQELGFEPGDSPPGNFAKRATAKQKRWYWAAVRRGEIKTDANGRYIRTHRLSGGWEVEVDVKYGSKPGIRVRTRNNRNYHIFVVGKISLGRSRMSQRDYQRPIQRFHRFTGWMEASPIIQKYYALARAYAREQMLKWVKDGLP